MELVRYAWNLLSGLRGRFSIWLLVTIVSSCMIVVPHIAVGRMIDVALASHSFKPVAKYAGVVVAAFFLSSLLQVYSRFVLDMMVHRMICSVKLRMFSQLYRKHIRQVLSLGTDSLYQRATQSMKAIQEKIVLIMRDVFGVTLAACISFAVITRIDPMIPLLLLFVFIPYIALRMYIFRKKWYTFKEQAESQRKIIQFIRERIQGIRLVKLSGTEGMERNQLASLQEDNIRIQLKHIHVFSSLLLLNILMMLLPEIIIYGYLGYKLYLGIGTVGNMLVAVGVMGRIRSFIWQVSRYGMMLQEFKEYLSQLFEIERLQDEPYTDHGKNEPFKGSIEFDHVTFRYDQVNLLERFSLLIRPGSKIGIVGLSGAGKTTLANLLIGLEAPDEGTIRIDGSPLKDWCISHVREQVSFITQQPVLLNASIRDNMCYGLDEVEEDRIWQALRSANLLEFVQDLDEGLETVIGEQGVQLSGGQKQRVAIARAYLHNPAIVILDEATASLDLESEYQVQQSLEQLCSDKTSLVIAHRLSTLHFVDEIVVLQDGVIIERGTHLELLNKKAFYYKLYMEQYEVDSSHPGGAAG